MRIRGPRVPPDVITRIPRTPSVTECYYESPEATECRRVSLWSSRGPRVRWVSLWVSRGSPECRRMSLWGSQGCRVTPDIIMKIPIMPSDTGCLLWAIWGSLMPPGVILRIRRLPSTARCHYEDFEAPVFRWILVGGFWECRVPPGVFVRIPRIWVPSGVIMRVSSLLGSPCVIMRILSFPGAAGWHYENSEAPGCRRVSLWRSRIVQESRGINMRIPSSRVPSGDKRILSVRSASGCHNEGPEAPKCSRVLIWGSWRSQVPPTEIMRIPSSKVPPGVTMGAQRLPSTSGRQNENPESP